MPSVHALANPARFLKITRPLTPVLFWAGVMAIAIGAWAGLTRTPADYLQGDAVSFDSAIKTFLRENCGYEAQEVWLQTLPRIFGYAFNPISFWLCRRDGRLEAVLCEVNNTFGEKHCYWIRPEGGIDPQSWQRAEKVFHVSPFFPVEGHYLFRFSFTESSYRVDINYHGPDGTLRLETWVNGRLALLKDANSWSLILRYGWMTPLVMVRIHLQALKLFFKRARFYRKPSPPQEEISR